MPAKLLVLGLDAATWDIILPNLDKLPNFRKLLDDKRISHSTIHLKERPHSASIWCSMFSGLSPDEHKHENFHKNGDVLGRKDVNADFIWDILGKKYDIKALNIPFVCPPYNFNCEFFPDEFGFSTTPKVIEKNFNMQEKKAIEILKTNPEIFITVFTALDHISHFYWGSEKIVEWYKKVDKLVGKLLKLADKFIIISDHGFCSWEKSKVHTLPEKTKDGRKIAGDHSPEAIVITNLDFKIEKPQDVFSCILKYFLK